MQRRPFQRASKQINAPQAIFGMADILRGHTRQVDGASFSLDGRKILTRSGDRTVKVWEAGTGRLLATLGGHQQDIVDAEFSPDGERIVTRADTARMWESRNGSLLAVFPDGDKAAQLSPDGRRIVVSNAGTPRVLALLAPDAGAPPEWFRDFLHYMAQRRLNSEGGLEVVPLADWLGVRDRLHLVANKTGAAETTYLVLLRQFVHD